MRPSTFEFSLRNLCQCLILLGLSTNIALGQVVEPVLLQDQTAPEAPTNRFGMPQEGWVIARYTVLADGTTSDVRVIDKMPASLSADTVEGAIASWRFAPATSDGAPIAWHSNAAQVIPLKVDKHNMFCPLFGVSMKLFLQRLVFCGVPASRSGSGNRPGLNIITPNRHKLLG